MVTTSDYRELSLGLHEAPANERPLTPFEASVEVRQENLIAQARLALGADILPNDPSVDMIIARSVHSVAARLRRLKAGDSLGRVMDKTKPVPGVKGGPVSPHLELGGILPIHTEIDGTSMVDSFALSVLQHGTTPKETLTIRKQLAEAKDGAKESVIGTLDVTVNSGKHRISPEVTVTAKEGQGAYQRRLNHAYRRYMECSARDPWLKAYWVTISEERDITLQLRPDNGIDATQALVACNEADRIEKLKEIHGDFASQRKWDYSTQRTKFMALGVLLAAKSALGAR